MAKCSICDVELPADAVYCSKCGMKVNRPGDLGPPPDAARNAAGGGASGEAADMVAADMDTPTERMRSFQAAGPRRTDSPEEELWQGTYSPKAMAGAIATSALLTVVIVAAWIVYREQVWWWLPLGVIVVMWAAAGGQLAYRMFSVRYRLTNQRFFHEKGILSRVTDRIEVIDMDDITFMQGILDRMFNTGTIKVTSSDRTHPELILLGIENVKDVAAKIDAARRQERIRRGLHIEQI